MLLQQKIQRDGEKSERMIERKYNRGNDDDFATGPQWKCRKMSDAASTKKIMPELTAAFLASHQTTMHESLFPFNNITKKNIIIAKD